MLTLEELQKVLNDLWISGMHPSHEVTVKLPWQDQAFPVDCIEVTADGLRVVVA